MADKEMQKREASSPVETERTKSVKVFIPLVDICETKDAIVLLADMPGVDEKSVDITLEKNVLTLSGKVEPAAHGGYRAAYAEYEGYLADVRAKGDEYIAAARAERFPVIILAGRPYHLDPEVNHGIASLIADMGAAVVSEDSLSFKRRYPTRVLNQWTYHSRLYAAAHYVAEADFDCRLVQLVSFGCGVDAITTDEVRSILESAGKLYTQIKIDEITNLGAVRIRLRSLMYK